MSTGIHSPDKGKQSHIDVREQWIFDLCVLHCIYLCSIHSICKRQGHPTLSHLVSVDVKACASVNTVELVQQYIVSHFVKDLYFISIYIFFSFSLYVLLTDYWYLITLSHNPSPILLAQSSLSVWGPTVSVPPFFYQSLSWGHWWGCWFWMPWTWLSSCSSLLALRSLWRNVCELGTSSRWYTRGSGFVNIFESIFQSNLSY